MFIKYLGTSSGFVTPNRYHSSVLIDSGKSSLVIDTGDGTVRSLLSADVDLTTIDAIAFTHFHADHFTSLASVITMMKLSGKTTPLTIYANKSFHEAITAFLNLSYISIADYKFPINFCNMQAGKEVTVSKTLTLLPFGNTHLLPKENYKLENNTPYISYSFLISEKINNENKSFVYSSDIGSVNDLDVFNGYEYSKISIECSHVTPGEILEFYNKSGKKGHLLLTHYHDDITDKLKKLEYGSMDAEGITVATDHLGIKL